VLVCLTIDTLVLCSLDIPCVDRECDHTTSIDVKENDTGLYLS